MTIRNKGQTQDAYQITEAWDEASASWNSFAVHGVPGNRGKAFTFTPNHLGRFSVNITSIAQRWANGEVNDGVLLASTHWDGVDYNSSETVRDRPSLRVQFVPPPSPLVLAYDMETLTADGRMKDLSGNGNHGTMKGTPQPTVVPGRFDLARSFASPGRIHVGSKGQQTAFKYLGGDMSFGAWVRINASETDGGYILSKPWNGNGAYNWQLYVTPGHQPQVRLYGNT